AKELREKLSEEIPDGLVTVFGAPPVEGLGTAGGFKIIVEDRNDLGTRTLQQVTLDLVDKGNKKPGLQGLFASFRADTPWLQLDIDRRSAKMMGVSTAEVFNTLQVYVGSLYVNDFNRFGRTWQVNIQAESGFRRKGSDLKRL